LGGVEIRIKPVHVALTGPRFTADNPHRLYPLQGTARGVLAAADKQGDASQRRPALPLFVCMVRQSVQDALGGHVLQRQSKGP
jgi:hypothetical protein